MNMQSFAASIVAILGKYALDKGLELDKEVGPKALDTAKEIFTTVLDRLRKNPKGEVLAEGFEEDPEVCQKPVEKELEKEVAADPDLAAQLQALMDKYEEAAKEYAGATGRIYQATLTGNRAIAQGPGAVAAGAGGVAVGGGVQGSIRTSGPHPQEDEDQEE